MQMINVSSRVARSLYQGNLQQSRFLAKTYPISPNISTTRFLGPQKYITVLAQIVAPLFFQPRSML